MLELAGHDGAGFDVVHNNSLHHLPVAMAPALPMPMLTTLHTPPLPWLESAMRLDAGASSFAAVVAPHRGLVGADHAQHLRAQRCRHRPVAGRPRRRPAPSGRDASCRRRRRTRRSTPPGGPGIPLVLAGPVLDRDYFDDEVEPRLGPDATYAGHLAQADLAVLVGGSAVAVVTPAWDEPYGLVAAEALACGTPVAAYARGGLPEVLSPDTGRLAAAGDVDELAAAIRDALARPGPLPRPRRGRAARSTGWSTTTRSSTSACSAAARRVIGYYVHHHGTGHLHRAMTVAPHLAEPVTGLSSLPRPEAWAGPWIELPRDDSAAPYPAPTTAAQGRLHWVPLGDAGLRARMAAISAWIDDSARRRSSSTCRSRSACSPGSTASRSSR